MCELILALRNTIVMYVARNLDPHTILKCIKLSTPAISRLFAVHAIRRLRVVPKLRITSERILANGKLQKIIFFYATVDYNKIVSLSFANRPYKCDMCSSSFAQRSNLMSHKRATHFNDKRYKCETCNRSFKRRRLLEYHIKATHTGERPYKCDQCNSTFVYPEHYKKHIRIHTGDKPFACEVCGKTFNSRDNRNAHRYIHSDKKPYECLVCHQGFMRKPLLYAHMESQNHMNDQIIINQPRIPIKKDGKNIEIIEECIDNDDGDIVYLNLNEQYIDDEFGVSAT